MGGDPSCSTGAERGLGVPGGHIRRGGRSDGIQAEPLTAAQAISRPPTHRCDARSDVQGGTLLSECAQTRVLSRKSSGLNAPTHPQTRPRPVPGATPCRNPRTSCRVTPLTHPSHPTSTTPRRSCRPAAGASPRLSSRGDAVQHRGGSRSTNTSFPRPRR